jgi:anti-sigma factor RsiW
MTHLTDDQIDELLMGSLEAGVAAQMREHAEACEACATRLAEIETPIASFKAVTLAWSDRRSATMPVRPARHAGARWGMGFAWGAVAAAVLLAAVIPVLRHEQSVRVRDAYIHAIKLPSANQQPGTPAVAAVNSASAKNGSVQDDSTGTDVQENAQEIASDNRLLAMVDEELNAPIPAPGSGERPATRGRGQSRTNTQGTIQD